MESILVLISIRSSVVGWYKGSVLGTNLRFLGLGRGFLERGGLASRLSRALLELEGPSEAMGALAWLGCEILLEGHKRAQVTDWQRGEQNLAFARRAHSELGLQSKAARGHGNLPAKLELDRGRERRAIGSAWRLSISLRRVSR